MKLSDNWMEMTKGGKRTSAYTCETCGQPVHKKHKSRIERFREDAAEFKRKRIDRMTE